MNTFNELQEKLKKFITERNWSKFHNPKNLAMSISIEAAELMELFQWISMEGSKNKIEADAEFKEKVSEEIADVVIYSLALALTSGIDLKEAILNKLAKNAIRFPPGEDYGYFGR